MGRRRNGQAVMSLIFAASLFASQAGECAEKQVNNPDAVIFEVHTKSKSLDPATAMDPTGTFLHAQLYESLLKFDPLRNEVIPWLAESYTQAAGGMSYTFKLRQGVKFHDGTEFNASAVKYSIDRSVIMAQPRGAGHFFRGVIRGSTAYSNSAKKEEHVKAYLDEKGVEVVDDYTVTVHLDKVYPPFPLIVGIPFGGMISPGYVEKNGGIIAAQVNDFISNHAAGTGPYMLRNFDIGSGIISLEAFPEYWGTPKKTGPAKIKKVIIKPVDDPLTRVLNLKTGESDMAQLTPNELFQLADQNEWAKNGKLVSTVAGVQILGPFRLNLLEAIALNVNIKDASGNSKSIQPFADKRVRQAFTYAFDYQTYLEKVLKGFGERISGPIPMGWLGYDPDLPRYNTDLKRAKQLIEEAGKDLGFSKDKPLSLTLTYPAGEKHTESAMLIMTSTINNLQAGLQLNAVPMAMPAWLSDLYAGKLDTVRVSWVGAFHDPDGNLRAFGDGEQGILAKAAGYKNPVLKQIITDQGKELAEAKREALIKQASRVINEDFIYVWLAQRTEFWAQRDWMKGYSHNRMIIGPTFYEMTKGY
jgi:peptide/nickel transport system substrate-binding protein